MLLAPPKERRNQMPLPGSGPVPLILVLGTTAAGKTRLSVALAELFHGEIVNCDCLQLWRGIPVLSAAPTEDEKCHVPHHMFGVQEPFSTQGELKTVRDWVDSALSLCEQISGRGKIPFLVGGTHYYALYLLTQLFDRKIASFSPLILFVEGHGMLRTRVVARLSSMLDDGLISETCSVLSSCPEERLQRAARGERLSDGVSDGVMQAIGLKEFAEPYLQLRDTLSRVQMEASGPGFDRFMCQLTNAVTNLFASWKHSVADVLASPISDEELFSVEEATGVAAAGASQPTSHLRECLLQCLDGGADTSGPDSIRSMFDLEKSAIPEGIQWEDFRNLSLSYLSAVLRTGLSTMKYAKSQAKWKSRFLRHGLPLYEVDTSSVTAAPDTWSSVLSRASAACGRHISSPPPFCFQPVGTTFSETTCPICKVRLLSRAQADHHFSSNRHKKALAGRRKREARLAGLVPTSRAPRDRLPRHDLNVQRVAEELPDDSV